VNSTREAVTIKRVVCLANSRKYSGRCVAGKELKSDGSSGAWIRPVSHRDSEELSIVDRRYKDESDPQVLDIIDIPLKYPQPKHYQSENWRLVRGHYWVRAGRAKWQDLKRMADDPAELWLNASTAHGDRNDRLSETDAKKLDRSLYLLHNDNLKVRVFAPRAAYENLRRRVQAHFVHRDVSYQMWMTDPVIEKSFRARKDGEYEIGECFLTVSLGEPYNGDCYKLVAAVITPDREGK
jgi:hypothetical protein